MMQGARIQFIWLLALVLSACTLATPRTPIPEATPFPSPPPIWTTIPTAPQLGTSTPTSPPSPSPSPTSLPSPTTVPPPIVYTEDAKANLVIALNGDTGEVLARIPVDPGPHDIALCREQGLLFTGNIEASTVSVIDTSSNEVIRTLRAGAGAHGVALDPACTRLYVANAYANTLSVFDLQDDFLVKEIPVGSFPEYVAVSPEGKWILTTNLGDVGSVTLIEGTSLSPLRTFRLGTDPHGWALSPDNTQLAIAQLGSNQVYLLDALTLETVAAYQTGAISEWAAFRTPDELWVTNIGADYVSIIDIGAGKVLERVTVGDGPHGIAFTQDGNWAFVSTMRDGTVVKIDAIARQVAAVYPVEGELHNLVVLD